MASQWLVGQRRWMSTKTSCRSLQQLTKVKTFAHKKRKRQEFTRKEESLILLLDTENTAPIEHYEIIHAATPLTCHRSVKFIVVHKINWML